MISIQGVIGSYGGLINRIVWQFKTFPFDQGEVVMRRTPMTFIDSLAEIYCPLLAAVPLWVPSKELLQSGGLAAIAESADAAGVSRITCLPTQLSSAMRVCPDIGNTWQSLKIVHISGEACPYSVIKQFQSIFPNTVLVNVYGSTEVAGDVSFAVLAGPHGPHPCANNPDDCNDKLIDAFAPIGKNTYCVLCQIFSYSI